MGFDDITKSHRPFGAGFDTIDKAYKPKIDEEEQPCPECGHHMVETFHSVPGSGYWTYTCEDCGHDFSFP